MEINGYSLEAQKNKIKAFCDYNEYETAASMKTQENPVNP